MSKKIKPITLFADEAHRRLDIFLSVSLGINRSQAQKIIEAGQVTVNSAPPKKSGDKLSTGDQISISPSPAKPKKSVIASKSASSLTTLTPPPPASALRPQIIAATPDYLVVEKPNGLLTHATAAHETATMAGWLLKKYPGLAGVGEDALRPGIVHRLDKEASGLLVVARTQTMFNALKQQFKDRRVEKEYLVLVHGKPAKDWDDIRFRVARSGMHERMAAVPTTHRGTPVGEGKEAHTEFTVERRFANCTLLRVRLHTGRMHQIRVHFLAYNHPVVGDPLYFQKKQKRGLDTRAPRLFLHCTRLAFTDLAGAQQSFASPLPPELDQFLNQLH